jgi:hypothetical protein
MHTPTDYCECEDCEHPIGIGDGKLERKRAAYKRKQFLKESGAVILFCAFLALCLAVLVFAGKAQADTITIREDGTAKTTNCSRGPLGDVACW